eukprot:GHVO01023830.1.p1 GENE.GHVO01023830.1~~GHVO01023830.1.p1  ORF type:complete len:418 (+),score=69.29 GHVO01023830.1:59-1312(+)
MNQKTPKPSLTGHRLKARKRDEKEKYDAPAFRDVVIQGFIEADNDLDKVSRYLDSAGSRLDYRRYVETLFDILFAGGILAPGGSVVEDGEGPCKTSLCVFGSDEDHNALYAHYGVFNKLIRRYKYLEKSFEEELKKLIMFLKGFDQSQRQKLAVVMGLCLANGLGNPTCLNILFEDHIVREGIAMQFAGDLFAEWLREKDIQSLGMALKRAEMETKLLDLLPINKRTQENFEIHFTEKGLPSVVEYQRHKAITVVRKDLQRKLAEMIKDEESIKEMIEFIKEQMKKSSLTEHETIVIVWNTLMSVIEWNKKEELVADQCLKHLRQYSSLLSALNKNGRSQLALMVKVQEFCYDNMTFLKVFQKIVLLFYKVDVLSEDVIMKWYKDGHASKGKSVFLDQMKKFVEWLENAEEESDDED